MPKTTWYLLIHRLPVRPLYFRARVRRLLAEAGAVPLKKAVYALPQSRAGLERLTLIADDVRSGGGEAFVCEARFIGDRATIEGIERLLHPLRKGGAAAALPALVGRTWVTRRGLHVDRLACAWVVRRFIDPSARFRFADPNDLRAGPGELTFDTPQGRFSHQEGRCSVETLVREAGIADDAVRRIAEIVHDLDLKDDRFRHPETAGIERLIAGIVQGHDDDRARLDRGLALFDDLYGSYRTKKRVVLPLVRLPAPPRRGPRGAT